MSRRTLSMGCTLVARALWGVLTCAQAHAATFDDAFAAAAPGVVLVLAGDNADGGGSAAGFVVSPEGKVVTLAQAVLNPKTHAAYAVIYVYTKPRQLSGQAGSNLMNRYRAQVIASNATGALDLALLQLEDAPADLLPLVLGDDGALHAGAEALALGHAETAGLWSGQKVCVISRVDNYAHAPGRQTWVLDRGLSFGQWGGPLLDAAGHVQGIVMQPLPTQGTPKAQSKAAAKPAPGLVLTSRALVGFLAQNNMALAAPGSPPADDPDSASDNPTPQPSTVAVVGEAPDAELARRRATAAAHGSKEPVTVAGPAHAAAPKTSAGTDSFMTVRRPYSLRQTHRQQLRAPMGAVQAPAQTP